MDSAHPVRVVGGGMTGLRVGLRLAQRNFPVVVHESEPFLGGLSAESDLAGTRVERFYHCILPTDSALLSLLEEIGLESAVEWNRTRTGFWQEGRFIEMTTSSDLMRFPALRLTDRVRLAWTVAYCGLKKSWGDLDHEPISAFLRRHGGERVFLSIWEPLLVAKLGQEYDRFAASFIWATITRLLSARKAKGRSEKLGFVKGGYGEIFPALRKAIEAAGGEVVVGEAIQGIVQPREGEGFWRLHTAGQELLASGVVLCTPTPLSGRWLEGSSPELAEMLCRVDYLGVVCEVLLLRKSLTPYYVLNLLDGPLPFTGVVELSNLTGREHYCGSAVVYLPRYCGQKSPVWSLSDEQLHSENIAGLQKVCPDLSRGDILAWRINRARHVQPIHPLTGIRNVPPVRLKAGLAYVSTAQIHPGPIYNDAVVRHVDSMMQQVIETLSE